MKISLFLFICSLFSLTSCQLNIDTKEDNEQEFIYVHILHENGIEWNRPMIPVNIASHSDGSIIGYSDIDHPVELVSDFYQIISYGESNVVLLTGEFTDIIMVAQQYLELYESDKVNHLMIIQNGKSIMSHQDLEALVMKKLEEKLDFFDDLIPPDFEEEESYEEYLIPKPFQPDSLNFHGI